MKHYMCSGLLLYVLSKSLITTKSSNNLKLVVHADKTKMKLKRGRCFNIFIICSNEALYVLLTFVECVVEIINLQYKMYVLLHMCC
jgi:hypothetical protein